MSDSHHPPPKPISLRRSYQLPPSRTLLLGIGLWVVIGIFTLYDPVLAMVGRSGGWAYLITGLLLIPTMLTHAELRSWLRRSGGSYRLIQATERNNFTFIAGWAYILGWAVLSALMLLSCIRHAVDLVQLVTPLGVEQFVLLIAVAMLLIFTAANIIGYRPPWHLGVWLLGIAIVATILLSLLVSQAPIPSGHMPVVAATGGNTFEAVALLGAGTWIIELTTDVRGRRRGRGVALLSLLGGPVLGGLLALSARSADLVLPQRVLFTATLPRTGQILMLAVTTVSTGVGWQVFTLLMLRQFQIIGADGWLPDELLRVHHRFRTPVWLIIIQGALTLAALLLGAALRDPTLRLAQTAAMTALVLSIGVNAASIALARHPRALERSFNLPLYPLIPASGAAISLLLLLALPLPIILLGLGWFALGEVVYLRVGRERLRTAQLGVTVFQDTTHRLDTTSEYPVVVPVANPGTASSLVAFGASIARYYGGHVTIVQVIEVPDQLPLDSRRIEAQRQLDLLERVLQESEVYGVPVEGITRLSRSVSQGILDTMAEESARLVILGWYGRASDASEGHIGHILDAVIENATCDLAILRGEWAAMPGKILVPTSGGPHAPHAADLALALTEDTDCEVTLLNVVRSPADQSVLDEGWAVVEDTQANLQNPERTTMRVVAAESPLRGILELAQDHDAIFLGASEMGVLEQQVFGRFPLQLARETEKPLALVRSYTGLTSFVARKAWQSLADVFPTLSAEEQMGIFQRMRSSARPNINYFVLIALSAVIATLGLLLNSPAVIIGAMLVAPLMSPIVAVAMGIVFGDVRALREGLTSTVQGVVAAIFIAILFTMFSPLSSTTPEVLARTRPTLLDLMVALASGLAGAYAIARQEVSEALPGVAVAAALMPPVCAIGIGLALGEVTIALGALLLFVANLVAIIFASAIVFLLLGIRPRQPDRQRRLQQGLIISVLSLMLVSLPLGFVLFQTVRQGQVEQRARQIAQEVIQGWEGAELVDLEVEHGQDEVTITGTLHVYDLNQGDGQTFNQATDTSTWARELDDALEAALRPHVNVRLFVIEGAVLDGDTAPD